MVFVNDSLSIVLVGDWNKLYIQPDWIAEYVFEKSEVEIGVHGNGSDFSIMYKSDGVIISPGQSRMEFSVINTDEETLQNLSRCINNFVGKAFSPQPIVYGLNSEFIEEEGFLFAEVLDSMSDTSAIIENGYEVVSTQVSRVLRCDDKIVHMDSELENKNLKVQFNEHHDSKGETPVFSVEMIEAFIEKCSDLLHGLGYEIEGDE